MTHITDAQVMSYLSAEEDAAVRAHLALCATCRQEVEHIVRLAGNAKSAFAAASDRAPGFWTHQRASAMAQLPARSKRVWRSASAFALMLLVGLLLFQFDRPVPRIPAVAPATSISDDALMAAVTNTLQQQVPDALEPAQLLVNERQLAEGTDTSSSAVTRR